MDNYTLYPVGDSCLTMTVGNNINEILNEKVIAIQNWINSHSFKGLQDVVIAYNSISLLYDPVIVKAVYKPSCLVSSFVGGKLAEAFEQSVAAASEGTVTRIPVCYDDEYGPDLQVITDLKQINKEEVVRLHTAQAYRIYMIGFLPGFPYLATVPDMIASPRKKQPVQVAAGGVGIAGMQTGIYPVASPGGWQIIGRTPVKVFNTMAKHPFLLKAGNYVQFYAITKEEFIHWIP